MTRRIPITFIIGVAAIALLEALLAAHVHGWGGAPARFVAVNMTALVWPAYLLALDGLLVLLTGSSPPRRRPHHFATLCLASIIIWCLFDWINFYFIRAWSYVGLPPRAIDRYWGYVLAFAAIVPGMLLSGQVMLELKWFDWARSRPWKMSRWAMPLSVVVGALMILWPLAHPDPVTNLTLWTAPVFLLDPINRRLGRPSMFRDWENGWYGRTLALFAGGLVCGLLWEFWNYWAIAKWVYHLPFLGRLENIRYFQMPVMGLLGFLPFGVGCWVMWQFMRVPLEGLVECLPDEKTLV